MKNTFAIFIALFIAFVLIANASAQAVRPDELKAGESRKVLSTDTQTKPKVERKRFSGTVVAIDVSSKTLVVKNWRGQTTFDAADAKLARRASLEDIKPGDRIQVSYAEEDGRKAAKVLIATPAKFEEENKTEAPRGPRLLKDESRKR